MVSPGCRIIIRSSTISVLSALPAASPGFANQGLEAPKNAGIASGIRLAKSKLSIQAASGRADQSVFCSNPSQACVNSRVGFSAPPWFQRISRETAYSAVAFLAGITVSRAYQLASSGSIFPNRSKRKARRLGHSSSPASPTTNPSSVA